MRVIPLDGQRRAAELAALLGQLAAEAPSPAPDLLSGS
jgi:hypothetical protein